MAYDNFIPEIWEEKIEHDLEKLCVFAEDTNRKYEGKVKKCGDTVHILTAGKPTIRTLARTAADGDIEGPETVDGTDTVLVIDQIRYFNFKVGDIDKAQAVDGVLDEMTLEADEGLADEVDQHLAKLHLESDGATPVEGVESVEELALTKDNVLDVLDRGQQKLQEHNVKSSTKVVVTIPPAVNTVYKRAFLKEDTNNHEGMKNGKVGMYSGMTIKMSNNVPKDTDGAYHIQMKTQRALGYAQPLRHVEPYRPEKAFADAVKGFILFGAKVLRPKEIIDLKVKIAA